MKEKFQSSNTYIKEEEQSLKLALGQPWVWSVINVIFLATTYEGEQPVLYLNISSSHWQCTVELARGEGGAEISIQISALVWIWNPNLSIGSPER